ncbi:MAG: hypothetical protein IT378_03545 [Sandaracinaceae bacterium]|nr:hypothetical protein [Sandaracinaceae bacterium]
MRRALVLVLALAAACGAPPVGPREPEGPTAGPPTTAEPAEGTPGRRPTRSEARALAHLMRVAEELRNLRFERPVPVRVQSREVITDFVREKIDVEELEHARVFYVALGLLPPDLDVRELLIRVLGEQIIGYYDPERGLMVLRDDIAEGLEARGELGEAEMVIVHELVHALQDQALRLGDRYGVERTIDEENAFSALVEGDATLAMIGHVAMQARRPLSALTRNVQLMRMLVQQSPAAAVQGQEIESAPPIVRVPLLSRYLDGMLFCASLHGQRDWEGVDDAHRTPPTSSEQILHPERYLAGEQPVQVELPVLPELDAAGWATHDEDTLGELESSIYFGLARGVDRDASAGEGWGGDRIRIYRNGEGRTAVVWISVWDDEAEATEAASSATRIVDAIASERRPTHLVERRGRALLIVRDLPAPLHGAVHEAFARTTAAYTRP